MRIATDTVSTFVGASLLEFQQTFRAQPFKKHRTRICIMRNDRLGLAIAPVSPESP